MGPNFVLDKGYQVTTAVTQFRFCTLTSDTQIKQTDAANVLAIGIAQETASAADAAQTGGNRIIDVRVMGISRAINGTAGALARMTKCATDNAGRVVAATSTQNVVGINLTAAAAQGDQVDFLLTPGCLA